MKKLSELYDTTSDVVIKDIKITSTEVVEGDLFVCVMGVGVDRHDYIDDAIRRGASACVISHYVGEKDVPLIMVPDTNYELPRLCKRFYDNVDDKLTIIGVTGTDGKTTTASMIYTLLGDRCGYIGTNGVICNSFKLATNNTTPDSDKLYKYMDMFKKNGCDTLVMEASSEAFFRGRVQTINFDMSIMTNLTGDHLNIHKTFDNYKECKMMLFKQTKKDGLSILNSDDKYFDEFRDICVSRVSTYGKNGDISIKSFKNTSDGSLIEYIIDGKTYSINSPLMGEYNAYNLAAAIDACLHLGEKLDTILSRIPLIHVDGRCEMVYNQDNKYIMIDYAHTVNGIDNVLSLADNITNGKKVVVIGAAGGRDPFKRPHMGEVIVKHGAYPIFTMEDPRGEDVLEICKSMASLLDDSTYSIVPDRHDAISLGISMIKDGGMLLVLGKGSDTYHIVGKEKIHFNDLEEVNKILNEKVH